MIDDDDVPEAEANDLIARAFPALQRFRQRDQEGFMALLGPEEDREQFPILMVIIGLLEGWLVDQAGDAWIDERITDWFDHRRDSS
jgi:hypothetical protein